MTVLIEPASTPNRIGVAQTYDGTFGDHLRLISGCCKEDVVWDMANSDADTPLWMCRPCRARVVNGSRSSAQSLDNRAATDDSLVKWIAIATGLEESCLTLTIDWK